MLIQLFSFWQPASNEDYQYIACNLSNYLHDAVYYTKDYEVHYNHNGDGYERPCYIWCDFYGNEWCNYKMVLVKKIQKQKICCNIDN